MVQKQLFLRVFLKIYLGHIHPVFRTFDQRNQNIRNRAEREAINAPVQGTAADIMKLAMIDVSDQLKTSGLNAKVLLQVHDELVLECPESELKDTAQLVQTVMESAYTMKIPLQTEARFGLNWGTMTEIKN